MTNEVKFKYGDASAYAAKLASEDGVDASALYFVSKDIEREDGVDFGGTIYRGNDALGTTCADHLKTVEAIQITGGPLANNIEDSVDVWPDDWKNGNKKVIPAGASLQEILTKLFCKETFPSASTSQGSLSASMSLTTLAFNPTDSELEVGSIVTTNALTASGSSSSTTPAKITGLSNGYALTESGDKQTGNIEFAVENVTESNNTHSIALSYSGFTETAPEKVSAATTVTMPAQTLIVKEGTCKVTATAGGSKFDASSPSVTQEYYNISNINTRKKETKTINNKALSATASKTTSDSVTGYFKYFMGYTNFTSIDVVSEFFNSDKVRALTTKTGKITVDGTTTVVDGTSITSNGQSIVVAVPSKYKLATFQNDFGGSEIANFISGTVAVANPTNTSYTTDYTVYVWPVAGGATITFKNVTITNA